MSRCVGYALEIPVTYTLNGHEKAVKRMKSKLYKDVMRCAIWYHLYNLKNVKNTHGGVLTLVKLQAKTWVFFTFFKLYKWYQMAQRTTDMKVNENLKNRCFIEKNI